MGVEDKVILTDADKPEILRYLGYRGSGLDTTTEQDLNECIELANQVSQVGSVWKMFELDWKEEGIELVGTGFMLTGNSIRKHLNNAKKAVMLGVTVGRPLDEQVQKLMVTAPARGVILNACGIALVEQAADRLQKEIDERLDGAHTGVRFSPGYGDLPLESQKDFIRILDTERKIGVRLNPNMLMSPSKSVTAIAAIM